MIRIVNVGRSHFLFNTLAIVALDDLQVRLWLWAPKEKPQAASIDAMTS